MYFDYAATTPVLSEIKEQAIELLNKYENPSSVHLKSQGIKNEIEETRSKVAKMLNTTPEHIFFTSGATESNNTVIKGFYYKNMGVKHTYFTSYIEHPSVLEPIQYLSSFDDVDYHQVSLKDILNLEVFETLTNKHKPSFCSFMLANNETGTIFPIEEAARILHENNTYFHVDATQAIGKITVDVKALGVDALSFSGHKIFAPKGIGVVYLKDPKSIIPLFHGGGQEKGIRCGTENVFAILSLKIAIDYFLENFVNISKHYVLCRTHFLSLLNQKGIPYHLNEAEGLKNIVSIRFPMKGDAMADILNFKYGSMISVGSACSENKSEKKLSHVLKNMGLEDHEIQRTTRISFGVNTKLKDIEQLVNNIENVLSVYQ